MPVTRTILNLKDTSIRDHLLDSKNKVNSVMDQTCTKSLSDVKCSPSTSAITLQAAQDTSNNVDHRHLLEKSSNDYGDSILSVNNNQQKSSPSPSPLDQYSMGQITAEPFQQLKENLVKPLAVHYQRMTSEVLTFSGKKNEDPGKWLDHVFFIY